MAKGGVMTRNTRIRVALNTAPSTCSELAAVCRLSLRSAHVGMWCLTYTGQARKTGRRVGRCNLYELTQRGRAMLRGKS
jgi:hypothetical protein